MKKIYAKTGTLIRAHKIWTTIIVIALIGGGYEIYQYTRPTGTPQYAVSRVHLGNIVQTVTGTGQVAAANQLSVTSQVSGTIETVNVKVGQHVNQGDLLATIDPTNALNSLTSAKIAYAKLTEAPKTTDLSSAQSSVSQSYGSAYNAVSSLYLDLQMVMPPLYTLLYGRGTFLSDQSSTQLSSTAQGYRSDAGVAFDKANIQYQSLLTEYAALSRQSSTSTIAQDLADAYTLAKNVANALSGAQNAITFITSSQPNYLSSEASTAVTEVTTWSNTINGDVSSLLSAQTSIQSAENALINLTASPDPLDIQSAELSLQQAQQTYDNYFIRAPFSGTIGLLPANVYSQAGGGTAIATVIGDQKLATLSLNEVDAASVKTGDSVTITFNAINNFTATGTVLEIDQVGTVSSGVVSYGVKVLINTADPRINPGMSVNATIVTNEIDNVLVVPSGAIKSQGNANYVQIFDTLPQSASGSGTTTGTGRSFASSTFAVGSTTPGFTGSTTRQFGGGANGSGRNASVTISSATAPTNQIITVGATDGTNTQVLTGLTAGEWVVTKTIAASATTATTATTPSLLNSLGGGARGAGGGFRGTAAPAVRVGG